MADLLKTIKGRKSVRTFDGKPVSAEDRQRLEQYLPAITNPFGIPVRFVLLDAKEHGLSSPVLSGETLYVAGIVGKAPYADVAFGYSFEKLVLYAWSLGIGTTWIGGTMKREMFEQAAGLAEGERMPCVSPLGYPAKKRSIREAVMRKGVGADSRMPAEQLFFDERGIPGKITLSVFLGDFIQYEVELMTGQVIELNEYTKDVSLIRKDGEDVRISMQPDKISLYEKESEEVLSC